MSRRRAVAVRVFLAVLLVASGCARGSGGGSSDGLVVAARADESVLDPPFAANVASGYGNANAPVFETLVELAPDFTVRPLLATSWEFRAPNTWRFHLRPGVTFHDGQRLDAKAVHYNVSDLWTELGILALGPDSAEIVDDLTIDLTPTVPNRRLVEQLVHPLMSVKAPGTHAGDGSSPEKRPTGTGPFKFSRYTPKVQLEVTRFDDYWGPKPRLGEITFRFLPDGQARAQALRAGDVDAAYDFRTDGQGTGGDSGVTVATSGVGAYDALLLNLRGTSPLRELPVRQAVASAIDRKAIVDTVWKDAGEVTSSLVPRALLGTGVDAVRGWAYDPARARGLLDGAGWRQVAGGARSKDGRRLEMTLRVYDADAHSGVPELLQRQLADVGVTVKIDTDQAGYGESLEKGDGDLFLEIGNQHDANAIFAGALFTAAPGGFADYATSFGAGPRYDEVFTRAIASPDAQEARTVAADAMRLAVDEVVAVVPLAGIKRVWGLRANVRGFQPHPSDINQKWNEVFVER